MRFRHASSSLKHYGFCRHAPLNSTPCENSKRLQMNRRPSVPRGSRPIRAITLDLDDTLWPCEPTIQRAERLAHEWIAARAPEVIAPWSIERLREQRMALHAARPDLRFDFVTLRRLVLQEIFRKAGADDAQSAEIIEGMLDVYMTARNEVELYPEVSACLERL